MPIFYGRRPLHLSGGEGTAEPLPITRNVPATVSTAIMAGLATLRELQTDYGIRDLYDLIEISLIQSETDLRLSRKQDAG